MLNNILSNFYERDIHTLIDEVNLYKNDEDLWQTRGSVKNSAGNLALHIIGGSNHFFGTTLTHTGYIRNRDQEFIQKGVERGVLVDQLQALIPLITKAIGSVNLEDEFPIPFDDMRTSNGYVLVRLLAHLDDHLGQVNYLRRIID